MSKVVKKVGRAISRVVKGVVKAVKTFAKSKLGKVIVAAAAVYFGGAALLGATGIGSGAAAAAGTAAGGGLAGASAGIQAAWSGLTGAFTGGGLSSATGVFSGGSAAAGAGAGAGGLTGAAGTVTGGITGATTPGIAGGAGVGTAATNGTIANAMLQSAKISAGTQLVGGLISGIGQQKAADDERKYQEGQAQAARDRYNQNVGTKLWGDAPTVDTGYSGPAQLNSYDPAAEARALAERRRREFEESYPQAGIVSRGMSYQQPTASNGFPIYNPYYYRG